MRLRDHQMAADNSNESASAQTLYWLNFSQVPRQEGQRGIGSEQQGVERLIDQGFHVYRRASDLHRQIPIQQPFKHNASRCSERRAGAWSQNQKH
jgi:hypothetical protein